MRRKPKLPAEVKAALEATIEYGWAAELKDAEEQLREDGTLEGHAFANLVTLDNWLNGKAATPESYCEGGDDAPRPSWPLRRLFMAEVENEADGGDAEPTLATARDSMAGGYEPYVGFAEDRDEEGIEAELAALIEWYGDDQELAALLTDDDWSRHGRCSPDQADPVR